MTEQNNLLQVSKIIRTSPEMTSALIISSSVVPPASKLKILIFVLITTHVFELVLSIQQSRFDDIFIPLIQDVERAYLRGSAKRSKEKENSSNREQRSLLSFQLLPPT